MRVVWLLALMLILTACGSHAAQPVTVVEPCPPARALSPVMK